MSCRVLELCAKDKNMSYDHHQPVNNIFHKSSIDFVGPPPETKSECWYILLSLNRLICSFHARAIAVITADMEIFFFIANIVRKFGSPSVVLTDQCPALLSAAWKNKLKLEVIDARFTAAYSPELNLHAERMVQTIKNTITLMMIDRGDECDMFLPVMVDAIGKGQKWI